MTIKTNTIIIIIMFTAWAIAKYWFTGIVSVVQSISCDVGWLIAAILAIRTFDENNRSRDEVERILSTSCTVYIDDQPINDTLPKTFPEKVDAMVYYLLRGTTVFKFRWHGPHGQVDSESVIHLQTYKM